MNWPASWTSLEPLPASAVAEWREKTDAGAWWRVDPSDEGRTPRAATGIKDRGKRLRAIGNGQVPAAMVLAFAVLARRAGVSE